MNNGILTIALPCWGQKHMDLARTLVLPSIRHDVEMTKAKVHVIGWTKPGQEDDLLKTVRQGLGMDCTFQAFIVPDKHPRFAMLEMLHPTIAQCLSADSRLLMLTSDMVFGRGSILTMWEYAQDKNVCVAGPHLRILSDAPVKPMLPNKELVRITLNHPHQCTASFWNNRSPNGTHFGGVSISTQVNCNAVMVHHLPNIFLASFTPTDLAYFKECEDFGAWDHRWPTLLMAENRYRYFASTELFYAAELTDPQNNLVELQDQPTGNESYRENELHHQINGCIVTHLYG